MEEPADNHVMGKASGASSLSKFGRSMSMNKRMMEFTGKAPSMKKMPSFFIRKGGFDPTAKQPSFFQRMFSGKNLKIVADEDEDEDEEGVDAGAFKVPDPFAKDAGSANNDEVPDPPMPKLGRPIDVELLVSRNRQAEAGLQTLMTMIKSEYIASVKDAETIPVSEERDRVHVTGDAARRMAKVRTKAGIHKQVEGNMNEIQKHLNFRKSALIIMNNNYTSKTVRKLEPIYVGEARSIIDVDNIKTTEAEYKDRG